MTLPSGTLGLIAPRSGLAQDGVQIGSPGIVDPDHDGEMCVSLRTMGSHMVTISPSKAIAQMLHLPSCLPRAVEQYESQSPHKPKPKHA